MGRIILTFHDIIELNQQLMEKGIPYKIHLHDACGSQSFTIEALSAGANDVEVHYTAMKKEVEEYFAHRRIQIRFSENKREFVVLQ